MKKIMRIISLLICVAMLLSSLPISAMAEEIVNAPTAGDVSENDIFDSIPDISDIPEPTEGQDNENDPTDSSDETQEQSPDDIIGEYIDHFAWDVVTYSNNVIASGECGAEGGNVTWQITDDSVLTISGNGSMADDYGFENIWDVKKVVIDEGVTYVNVDPIYCPNLVSFEVNEANPAYCSVDGVLFNKDKTKIILYPNGKEGESYVIPNGVTTIGRYAFSDRAQLRSITIPEGVTEIGDWAFSSCYGLSRLMLPSTVEYIGGAAFAYLPGISEIELADGCNNYRTVDGVLFTADMSTIVAYPAGKSDTEYTVPAGVTEIGTGAFYYCVNLTSINIPDGVSSIGSWAFQGCSSFRDIKIPASVHEIHWCAFSDCTSLESIVLPRNLRYAGGRIFAGCSSLTDIYCKSYEGQYDWAWDWHDDIPAEIHWGYDDGTVYIIASGECGADGDNVTWQLTDDGVLTISGSGAIADWWGGFPWEVENQATSIVIEEGITRIGAGSLNLGNANSITMPNSLTSIGDYAFGGCYSLLSINIPAGVTIIENGDFKGCEILVDPENPAFCSVDGVLFSKDMSTIICYPSGREGNTYVIPNSVTVIGNGAFSNCSQFTSITIPDGVKEIGNNAFSGCSIDSIYIPKSVEWIGWSAFANCINLQAIAVDEANPYYCSIDGVLFTKDMSDLLTYPPAKADTSYVIPNGVGRMANDAFSNCKNLTDITIPGSVTHIGWWAFSGCDGLNTLVMPKNVSYIGSWAFENCQNLTDIYLRADSQVGEWSSEWNQNVSAQIHWGYDDGTVDIIANGECGAEGDNVTWQLTDDGVLTISGNGSIADDYRFENSWLIKRTVIGEGVTGINANALNDCTNLASIEVNEANPAYCSVDGVLFNKDMTIIYLYPNGKEDESYDIPVGVTTVGDFAFSGRDQLKSLTIPDGVKEIGRWAFSGCYGLSRLVLPNTVEYIDGAAFACLLGISEIELAEGCANYCTVDGVLFTADMSTLVAYPAGKSDAEYTVPAGVTEIGSGAFHYCVNLTSINISDGVLSIGYGAFQGCSSLRDIEIPASVQDIQWCVFIDCRSLESIVLPRNLGCIGGNQFIGCSSLTDIYCKSYEGQHDWDWNWNKDYEGNDIPAEVHWGYDDGTVEIVASGECGAEGDNVTWQFTSDGVLTISGSGAIADWLWIPWEVKNQTTSIVIEEGVTRIGEASLQNFGNLDSITIPGSVTSIGSWALSGCNSSLSITIPASVTSISSGIFGGCEFLVDPEHPAFCSVDGVLFSKDMSTIVAYPGGKEGNTYVIPNNVTQIGNNAFSGSSNLASIYIPKSVEGIGWSVFTECSNLSAIVVDEANPYYCSIDGVLFSKDMSGLLAYPSAKADTSYVIPDGVDSIDSDAFSNCKNLTEITIPGSVTYIGWSVFRGCDSLNTVVIPKNVYYIGPWAFMNCPNLTDIYCKSYEGQYDWEWNWNKDYEGNDISAEIHWGYDDGTVDIIASGECGAEGDNVTWQFTSDGVLTISGSGAIDEWANFPWEVEDQATSVVIEEGITGIGRNALFYSFTNLTAIEVDENNPEYCSIDGVLFSKDESTIYCYPRNKEGESYDIPNGVTSISGFAFADRSQLMSITIPEGVTEIGAYAFSGCTGLTSIVLPKTVEQIGGGALIGLAGVEAIELTEGCANYCTVDGVLFTADMSVLVAYPAGKPDTEYNVPTGVTEICDGSFNGSKNLISVVISNGVRSIEFGAFANCSSLRNIEIPDSVQSINWSVFSDCTSLESIVLPRYLGWVGGGIFTGCSSLTDIYCMSDEGQYEWDLDWNKDYEGNDIPAVVHWGTHIHSYSEDWSSDEDNHWHECSCGEKADIAVHRWDVGVITIPATDITDGIKTFTCTVCKNTKIQSIPAGNFGATFTSAKAMKNDTVILEFTVDKPFEATAILLGYIEYDKNALTLDYANIEFCTETFIKDTNEIDGILVGFSRSSTVSGTLFRIPFIVSDTAQDGDYVVSGLLQYQVTGVQGVFDYETNSGVITVRSYLPGDTNGDSLVNADDAALLMWHTFRPDRYEVTDRSHDYNKDGMLNADDATYLMWHTFRADRYPLE